MKSGARELRRNYYFMEKSPDGNATAFKAVAKKTEKKRIILQ